ncbi:PASTA domain-containing protein [Longimicrobium sp.]|uniref:PASTA domain-containing protein n=1 Tax=Longimicrobium sp. TaxID=2029185 RepID=UPI002CE419FE|nr:PASTA domain-containing protein [Longimicrobium sp.]HSU16700.1 PASTA domain-containing protein [Longimicrobium sp.]
MKAAIRKKAVPPRPRGPGVRQRVKAYFDERRLLKYIIYCGLGGFFAGYLFITLLFFPGFGRSAIVTVPDVRGMNQAAARRALSKAGLEVQRGPTLNHPRVPANRVLSQVPLPGQEAARGSAVRLIFSAGPDRRAVPSIEGMDKDDAIGLLQRMGFQVRLRTVPNMKDEGSILAMDPRAGSQVPMPGIVVLTLSAGPPKILAPGVTGISQDEAAARLEAAGLRVGRISYDSASTAPLGDVVGQSPEPGDSVRMGGSVRITISGRNPHPPPPPAPVDSAAAMPDTVFLGDEPPAAPAPPPPPPAPNDGGTKRGGRG